MLRELWEIAGSWVRDERESWRRWLAWRRADRALRQRVREVSDEFRREMKAAGARLEGYRDSEEPAPVRAVRDKYRPQFEAIDQERGLAQTHFLRFEADRFNIALPQDRSEARPHGSITYYAWYPEWVQGEAALTDTGIAELRMALATEHRRRRQHIVANVSHIGSITDLISVTTAYCKRERVVVAVPPTSSTAPTAPTPTTSTTTSSTTTTSATTTSATTPPTATSTSGPP